MLYAFELSGEHEQIPRAEALACLDVEGMDYSEHVFFDQCLVVDILGETAQVDEQLRSIADRLAMCHHVLKVAGICPTDPDTIRDMVESTSITGHITTGKTYVVRAKRIKHHTNINSAQLEGRVGGSIYRKGFSADLKNADVVFRLILSEQCVFGSIIASIDRSAYEARAPHKKPFFYPGVLMPRVARALTNIAGIRSENVVFDPFCGTAGMLLEAGLIGASTIGLEVRAKILTGAQMNLEWFDTDHSLIIGDACQVPLVDECVDAIITDPPYGRSARIEAESLHHLYEASFTEMYRVLAREGTAIVVSEMPVEEYALNAGFVIRKEYVQRVHRSLTRLIAVLYKE
ncbi:MAG: N-6 DNA methylase [Methanosarcinaceae archaeon]|nr:N-6 DNA methylase [Methanosarcinaceae archaeon]